MSQTTRTTKTKALTRRATRKGSRRQPAAPTSVEGCALCAELLAALKASEFGFNHRRCVVCAGWNMGPNGETDMVHTKNCIVGLAIAKAEKRRTP